MSNKFNRAICITAVFLIFTIAYLHAQNSKIKCYFNHPVNNSLSTGTKAVYLKGTFPDTISAYINRAKYSLDFAIYAYTSVANDSVSQIAKAVNRAYKRGVKIRWINNGSSSNTGMSMIDSSIQVLSSPNTSSYGLMHNKFVVIDINSPDSNDVYLITGSYNFSVQQTNKDYNNLVILQSKQVATAYYKQFNQMWGGTDTVPNLLKSAFGTHKVTSTNHYFNVNGTLVQVHFSPKDSCTYYLTKVVNSANNDLAFGVYAFTDNNIATAILNKYNSNLTVRGIEDAFGKTYSPYTTLSSPLGNNMVVYTGTGLYHSKIMVVDALLPASDPQVATGSFNWSGAAQSSNDENLIIIHDAAITNQFYQALCNDISVNGGAPCLSPLPVIWSSFNVSLSSINNVTNLNWGIENEINANHFEIERSLDGISFNSIGNVTVTAQNKYQFVDENIQEGFNFYRIKQVDENGSFSFSKILNVYNRPKSKLIVYPNPVSNLLNVLLPLDANRLSIYSSVGTKLMEYDVHLKSSLNIDVSHLAKGGYYIQVQSNNLKTIKEFNKL